MRTWRYSKEHPEGVIFDTTGQSAPYPPSELNGWFDTPARIHVTRDELIDAVVRRELAKQPEDKDRLEKEVRKKTKGKLDPHFAAKESTLIKVLDNK